MRQLFFSLLIIIIPLTTAIAQDLAPIETDRPDQTETPAIVPSGMFQVESGINYEKSDNSNNAFVSPTVLVKYGINDNFELRLIADYTTNQTEAATIKGFDPILLGFKVKLFDENGTLPKSSFIAHLSIPKTGSKGLQSNYFAPEFRFTMQHTLTDRLNLGYNLGAQWDGESPEPVFIYTLTTGCSISKKLGTYVELYGYAPQNGRIDHRADGGFTYLINSNTMIDLSAGYGITANAPEYFTAFGFSFRL